MSDQTKMQSKKLREVNKKGESARTEATDLSDSCFSKSVCSSMDCTGLIPALPSSEDELESYEEMYQFCLEGAARPSSPATDEPHTPK